MDLFHQYLEIILGYAVIGGMLVVFLSEAFTTKDTDDEE